eukprot:scaffold363_cov216-Skeletonema_marinoi.AAC.3
MYLLFKTLAPQATPASAFATLAFALCLIIAFDSLLSSNPHDSDHRYVRENRELLVDDEEPTSSKKPVTVMCSALWARERRACFTVSTWIVLDLEMSSTYLKSEMIASTVRRHHHKTLPVWLSIFGRIEVVPMAI